MIIGHFGFSFGFLFKCFHFLKAKVPKTSATSPATPSSASSFSAKKPAEPPAPPMKGASSFKGPPTGLNEACKSMQKFLLFFLWHVFVGLASPFFFHEQSHFWYLRSVLFFAWIWWTWRTNFWTVTGSNGMLGMAHKLRQSGTLVESGIPRIKGNTFPRMGPRFCWVGNHGELCWNFRIFIPKIGGNAWKWAMKPSNQLTILLGLFAEFWWSIFWYVQMNPDSNVFWSHGQPPNT